MMEVVTGGSGSGKSAYAEQKICGLQQGTGRLYYIATMYPYGSETERKMRSVSLYSIKPLSPYRNREPNHIGIYPILGIRKRQRPVTSSAETG